MVLQTNDRVVVSSCMSHSCKALAQSSTQTWTPSPPSCQKRNKIMFKGRQNRRQRNSFSQGTDTFHVSFKLSFDSSFGIRVHSFFHSHLCQDINVV